MTTSLAKELTAELEDAVTALQEFDAERLEAIEQRIRSVTARQLASVRNGMPELLERHALLQQMLEATEANLKVLVSVLHLDEGRELR